VIDLANAPQPRASIVVVTYGSRPLVRRALEAVRDNTPPVYELILVDNASPDGTGDWLAREVRGATLLRAPRNVGFGAGANWGALAARSPALCFLNSDAFVHAGWLGPLLDRLASDPGVGAVVPCLLNLDGSLQEAGTIVGSDGATFAFGYGADASDPGYRFARAIDYGSAACLLVRRAAFARAGGFDTAYGVGYCEDVDLALRLADLGYRTVYEPASAVTHVRHGSSSAAAAARHVDRNRLLLLDRWWRRLAGRPALADLEHRPHRALALRDAPATDTVLVVADRIAPEPGVGHASLGSLGAWLDAVPGLRITLLLLDPARADRAAPAYWAAGIEVVWGEAAWDAWLTSRRFHYSVLVLDGSRPPRLDAALRATQPQALRVDPRVPADVLAARATLGSRACGAPLRRMPGARAVSPSAADRRG
jgi:GT2 family glycosyltransferase